MGKLSDVPGHDSPNFLSGSSIIGIEELGIGDLVRTAENPLLCPRTSQVTKLAEIIDLEWLVHVHGTTTSGETTLASSSHTIGALTPRAYF